MLPDQIMLAGPCVQIGPKQGFAAGMGPRLCSVIMQGYRLCPGVGEATVWALSSGRPRRYAPLLGKVAGELSCPDMPAVSDSG